MIQPYSEKYSLRSVILIMLLFAGLLFANNPDYNLQPGDKIQISYIDIDRQNNFVEKSDLFTIRDNGTIQHPLAGQINLQDANINQAEERIFEAIGKFFTNPTISVTLVEKNTIQVLLYGAVNNSGIIKISPQTRVAQFLLSEGQLKQDADLTNIQIIKNNGDKIVFSMPEFLYKNDNTNNVILEHDDRVIVPTYSDRNFTNIVSDDYILKFGNVLQISLFENSEGFQADRDIDVLTIDNEGYIYHDLVGKVHVGGMTIRSAESQITSRAGEYMNDPVTQISLLNLNVRTVFIFGEVKNPGYHQLKGSVRLSEFIAKYGGGFQDNANIKEITVNRDDNQKVVFNFEDFLYKRNEVNNIMLADGDRIIVPPKNVGLSYKISNAFRRYYWILQFLTTSISLYILIETVK